MQISIIGAGIGGLTTALKLHKRGFDVQVFESAQVLKPLGVGINILPHAVKELDEVGLLPKLLASGIETSSLSYYNKLGQLIWKEPRGRAAGYHWPQFSIHRGELQMILYHAAVEALGQERIHTGQALLSLEQDEAGVTLFFENKIDGESSQIRSDIVIAADGIHSVVRKQFYPNEGGPKYGQRILWRAVSEAESYLDGQSMFMAGHFSHKFVAYPISEPLRQKGRSLVNWIAELAVPDKFPPKDDWNRKVDKSVFYDAFKNWKWDWVDIPRLIETADAVYEFPMVDRDPLPAWVRGRVALLGDAAHPMYPIGSNGASQAILDARSLADCLEKFDDPLYALREYEAERLPKTAGIVLRNRLNGPEQVMQIAEERAPQGFSDIESVIPLAEREAIAARYKMVAGFDRDSVNRGR